MPGPEPVAAVDLYWLPLGAGGHSVRLNGRVYEALAALRDRRERFDLYHSALEVLTEDGWCVIESAPVGHEPGVARGVVAEGAVGSRWARRLRIFRYEVRCWWGGVIPDVAEAVASPQRVTQDALSAQRVLDLVPLVPTPVWGRDELRAGEMWNSNSIVAWLLETSGIGAAAARLPDGGRAPGWEAGIVVADRTARRRLRVRGAADGAYVVSPWREPAQVPMPPRSVRGEMAPWNET